VVNICKIPLMSDTLISDDLYDARLFKVIRFELHCIKII